MLKTARSSTWSFYATYKGFMLYYKYLERFETLKVSSTYLNSEIFRLYHENAAKNLRKRSSRHCCSIERSTKKQKHRLQHFERLPQHSKAKKCVLPSASERARVYAIFARCPLIINALASFVLHLPCTRSQITAQCAMRNAQTRQSSAVCRSKLCFFFLPQHKQFLERNEATSI